MEESPHKCPVCNRSFNQRSNLKTHLLTHTDHKPYECNTCGKVFRRNCDLRRHALTHTIGGDVPPDSSEPSESDRKEKNTDTEFADDDEIDDEDDVDMELEVDSPVNSPSAPNRRSPTPSIETNDVDAVENDDEESVTKKPDHDIEPSAAEPRHDEKKIEMEVPEVTHCHHDGGQTHYTMRPTQDYYAAAAKFFDVPESVDYSQLRRQSSTFLSKMPESYMPMLHVRRDLHQKNVKSHSTFLESMPFRKRNAAGFLREPPAHDPIDSTHKQNPLNLSNRPPIATPLTGTVLLSGKLSDDGNMSQKKTSFAQDSKPFAGEGNPLREHGGPIEAPLNLNQAQPRIPPPAHPPRRSTGFSIEDIMRR